MGLGKSGTTTVEKFFTDRFDYNVTCGNELAVLIQRCRLQGAWRQGGKQSRAVFLGDGFIINPEASSTWTQGAHAQEIDARLRAARSSGH